MKAYAWWAAAILLAGCAGTGGSQMSGTSSASGSSASGFGASMLNQDVADAVARGSTHYFDPYTAAQSR